MSSLDPVEKRKLEELLNMGSGYVLTFSDSSFSDFFADKVNIDIHSERYLSKGTSKAKKLREFWKIEPDHLVGKVLLALVEHANSLPSNADKKMALKRQCKDIAKRLLADNVNLDPLKETAIAFDAKHLAEQIRRLQESLEKDDPSLAIGTAKELIETCCKTILDLRGKPLSGTPDIPTLTKATLKELKLIPDGIPQSARGNDVIKRLLQNLGTIGNNLNELRGLYGTGHGKHGKSEGLSKRHAKLAAGAAVTLAIFLFDTHEETR